MLGVSGCVTKTLFPLLYAHVRRLVGASDAGFEPGMFRCSRVAKKGVGQAQTQRDAGPGSDCYRVPNIERKPAATCYFARGAQLTNVGEVTVERQVAKVSRISTKIAPIPPPFARPREFSERLFPSQTCFESQNCSQG